jgi:hypothetical protein
MEVSHVWNVLLKLPMRNRMMSSDKIYLSKEEQIFLMEMLELQNPVQAAEKYALLMVEEKADPLQLQKYLRKTIANFHKLNKGSV